MQTPSILAIDIGSSSVRAALYNYEARPFKGLKARREWSFVSTPGGGSEMNANTAFGVLCDAIDEVLAKASHREIDITHVAMCSFWHSLMGVDAKGKPTTPVLGWADTRSGRYSAEMKKRFDEHDIHNRTGAHFHSSFWPAKLLWLRREQPAVFARTQKWLGFGDYVAMRLTGRTATSISMASATGVFHQRRCDWDGEILRYLKVQRTQLPEIAMPGSLGFTRTALKRWPQLKNAALLPPIGDGAADHVGSCGPDIDKASLMIGTSAAMRFAYEGEPPGEIPDGLWCYRIDGKRVVVGGALSDGGNLYEWCRRTFRLGKNAEDEIRRRDPQRILPTVVPLFHGERSTGYREDARGEILDLRPSHDGIDILNAAMLAVAERLGDISHRLNRIVPLKEIVASGRALRRSPLWREMISAELDRRLEVSTTDESALRGVVRIAVEQIERR